MRTKLVLAALLLAGTAAATAQETAPASNAPAPPPNAPAPNAQAATSESSTLGMSILGNQEAPKSLVIVPWKSSEIGNGIGVSRALDTRIRAVDKDVFMRELKYYSIRSGSEK
jgi:hypothetical protein